MRPRPFGKNHGFPVYKTREEARPRANGDFMFWRGLAAGLLVSVAFVTGAYSTKTCPVMKCCVAKCCCPCDCGCDKTGKCDCGDKCPCPCDCGKTGSCKCK